MLKRCPLGMAVGAARGNVETVQDSPLLDQFRGYLGFRRKFPQQARDDMAPGFLSEV